jgi:glycerol dehydrogenase-like iron-containing ADH family enzyme
MDNPALKEYLKALNLFQDAYHGDRVACAAIVQLLQKRCGIEDIGARAMKILEELSPGGSEYFQDPARCKEAIQERIEMGEEMKKQAFRKKKSEFDIF